MDGRNLYDEIEDVLDEHGHSIDEIAWVSLNDSIVPVDVDVDEFLETAKDFDYDPGYGTVAVDTELIVMLECGDWLERSTYDGSEWFDYRSVPTRPEMTSSTDMRRLIRNDDYDVQVTWN